MIRLFLTFTCLFTGLWLATQRLAELVKYDKLLGNPFMVYHGVPYYWPWKYFVWFSEMHSYIPQLFGKTYLYIFFSFVVLILFLYFLGSKHDLTSHGTARWADYKDMLNMDLISGHGVVVGLYDGSLTRLCTKFLRWLERIKIEKKAFGEMAFDKKKMAKLDLYHDYYSRLSSALEDATRPSDIQKLKAALTVVKQKIDNPPKYNPRAVDPLTVYPYCFVYDCVEKIYKKLPHFFLRDNSNKHLAVIAPTRSGKGVGLIIPTLLGSWDESVIVNDIKSENWGITAGYRKRMGQVAIKFEPTASDGSTARWNPLDEIRIGTPEEISMAQNIAAVIADYEGKGKPDHWTANAADVITACILHLKYAHFADPEHYPNSPSLSTVASFLKANFVEEDEVITVEEIGEDGKMHKVEKRTGQKVVNPKDFLETLEALMNFEHVPDEGIDIREWDGKANPPRYVNRHFTQEDLRQIYPGPNSLAQNPGVHPRIYETFVKISRTPANECGSIISTANTALKEYSDPVLAANTSISDFCVDDLMNYRKPVSCYLVTPPSDILRLSPIFRLFFEMMVRHHARFIGEYVNGQAKSVYKHKCLFLMDEFSSLGNLQSFAATLSYIAGYGMKVFLINQGMPQINGIYGKDNQILMNCHLQIFYAPNDNDTGSYAEKLLGNKTIVATNVSDSGFMTKKQYSRSEIGRALMTGDEIKRMGEQEIILASGNAPILTDKVKYYQNDYFLSKLYQAPVASDVIRPNPYPARDALLKAALDKRKKNKSGFDFKPQFDLKEERKVEAS